MDAEVGLLYGVEGHAVQWRLGSVNAGFQAGLGFGRFSLVVCFLRPTHV